MEFKHNSSLKKRAQELRKNATPQENHLWYDFLAKYHIRFYRQVPIDNYILDFYCRKLKIGIELDGSQHYEENATNYDIERTKILGQYGIEILRYSNYEINNKFQNVCQDIDNNVKLKLGLLD